MELPFQAEKGPKDSSRHRSLPAPYEFRRAAASVERAEGRNEFGRPTAVSALPRGAIRPAFPGAAKQGQTRANRPVAGLRTLQWRFGRAGSARYLLHTQLVAVAGPLYSGADRSGCAVSAWRLLARAAAKRPSSSLPPPVQPIRPAR